MSIERRLNERTPVSLEAHLEIDGGQKVKVRTLDVSAGGALVDSPFPLPLNAITDLKFAGRLGNVNAGSARVVRSRPAFWNRRHAVAFQFEKKNYALKDLAREEERVRRASWQKPEV